MGKFSFYHGSQYNGSTLWNKWEISIKQTEGHCISLELCVQSVKCASYKLACCNTLYMWLIQGTQPYLLLIMKRMGSTLVMITKFFLIPEPLSKRFCLFQMTSSVCSPIHKCFSKIFQKCISPHTLSLAFFNHVQFYIDEIWCLHGLSKVWECDC